MVGLVAIIVVSGICIILPLIMTIHDLRAHRRDEVRRKVREIEREHHYMDSNSSTAINPFRYDRKV